MKITIVHRVCVLALLFFSVTYSTSQTISYNFTNYSIKDGLPSSQAYDIIQDHMGFIWIATDRGVVRFNGDEFQTFTVRDGLTSNVIFHIKEDEEHRIWCMGSDKRLCYIMNPKFTENPKIEPFPHNNIIQRTITSGSKTLSIHPDVDGIEICSSANKSSHHRLFISYSGNTMFFDQNEGISIIDDNKGIRISKTFNGFSNLKIKHITTDCTTELEKTMTSSIGNDCLRITKWCEKAYFNCSNELYTVVENSYEKTAEFTNNIIALKSTSSFGLLIGLRKDGLIRVDQKGFEEVLIPDIYCSVVLEDSQNGLWIGSLFNGVYYLPKNNNKIISFGKPNSIAKIAGNSHEIYFTNSEYDIFSLKSGEIQTVKTPFETNSIPCLKTDISDNFIKVIISSFDKDLKKGNQYVLSSKDRNPLAISYEPAIKNYLRRDSSLIVLTSSGIQELNLNYKPLHKKINLPDVINSIELFHDTLFLTTETGVKSWNNLMVSDYKRQNAFLRNPMLNIHSKPNGDRIYTSKNHGTQIRKVDGTELLFTEHNGLLSDLINGSLVYNNNLFLWSNKGISILDSNYMVKNYTSQNGLISNHILDLFVRNDTAWVATDEGLSILDLTYNTLLEPPNILLTGIAVSGTSRDLLTDYDLTYKDQFLDVSYQGVNFVDKGKSTYRYKLEGYNETWIETKERVAHFSRLQAGEFDFLISMKTASGWTEPTLLFSISKGAAFWQTWWFSLCMAALGITVIFFLIKSRLKRLNRENALALSATEFERKALQAQMNPHFVFNSLSSLQSLIIDKKNKLAEEYLIKFSRLTRLTLNHSSEKKVRLKDELVLIKNYIELEMLRFQDKFTYSIDHEIVTDNIYITPMLIQPFVENAILHGLAPLHSGGKLQITSKFISESMISISILDNGIGLEKALIKKTHTSRGISLVRERLKLLSSEAELTITENPDPQHSGTLVILRIPYSTLND